MKKAILLAGALTVAMAALTACSGNGKAEPETTAQAAESAAETQKETTAKAERNHGRGSERSGSTDCDYRGGGQPGDLFKR